MKTCDMHGAYAGAAGEDTATQANQHFLRLAPAMVTGCTASMSAEIVGAVRYRQGDGVMQEICPGRISVEVCFGDAVISWADDDHRGAVAVPFRDFHRHVMEGAIRLLTCSPPDAGQALPTASPEGIWGDLAAISQPPAGFVITSRFRGKPSHTPERTMSQRLDYYKASKEATNAMLGLEKSVSQFGLEKDLLELVRLRASQINGCGYCVDYHITEAKKLGEADRRLHSVIVWREAPFFTPRERAALTWTESLTRLAETNAPDEDFAAVREHFSDKEIVDLTVAIIAVNGWNRLGVGFRRSAEA